MEKVQVVNYQGYKIIFIDFNGLKSVDEITLVIEIAKPFIRNNPTNSVYTLSNLNGMHFNNSIRDLFTQFTGGNKEYVKASAIIGVSGLQNIMINAINKLTGRKLKSFPDELSAKNWLVSQT